MMYVVSGSLLGDRRLSRVLPEANPVPEENKRGVLQADIRVGGICGACMPCRDCRPITAPSEFCAFDQLMAATSVGRSLTLSVGLHRDGAERTKQNARIGYQRLQGRSRAPIGRKVGDELL